MEEKKFFIKLRLCDSADSSFEVISSEENLWKVKQLEDYFTDSGPLIKIFELASGGVSRLRVDLVNKMHTLKESGYLKIIKGTL